MFFIKVSCLYLHLSTFRLFAVRTQNLALKITVTFFRSPPPKKKPPNPAKPNSYAEQYLAFNRDHLFLSADKCIYNALASVTGTTRDTLLRHTF